MTSTTSGRKAKWGTKASLLRQIEKWWERGSLLQVLAKQIAGSSDDFFPIRLVCKTPESKALSDEFEAVRHWITTMRNLEGFRLVEKTVQHRIIGENRLPAEVWVDELGVAVKLIGKTQEAEKFRQLYMLTKSQQPGLLVWVCENPLKALAFADEWQRLLAFVSWRECNASPDIYLRQVNLAGVDSKFIESHRGILSALLDAVLPQTQIDSDYAGVKHFESRYGFRSKPERVRFRILDETLSNALGLNEQSDKDVTLTMNDFAGLAHNEELMWKVRRVFITENEINFLAFPDQRNSIILFGAGYGFSSLATAAWLQSRDIYYWGDIDTHGLAILDQCRSHFPHTQSLLMNMETLLSHKNFWGQEAAPVSRALHHLSTEEQVLYEALITNSEGDGLRLEQERVCFESLERWLDGL